MIIFKSQPSMFSSELPPQSRHLPDQNQSPEARIKSPQLDGKKYIYGCECGKKYMSFPALYVHGRIKHNIKLSSNSKVELWKTNQTDEFIQKTFYLSMAMENSEPSPIPQIQNRPKKEKAPQKEISKEPEEDFPSADSVFREFIQTRLEDGEYEILFDNLYRLIREKWGENSQKEALDLLPYELNAFALERVPGILQTEIWSEGWIRACRQLLKFGGWLFEKSYTKYLVVENRSQLQN